MEKDEIHTQSCNKFPRVVGNGDVLKIGQNMGDYYPDDEDDGDALKRPNTGTGSIGVGDCNRLRGWHHSSRIIRVSRASGGKDRHSKVWTSKGLRDRRVRLSVTTAIQFYDLQDRLGYDQPSKAVEWLITAAADAIAELPSLNSANFPDTPKQLSDEKRTSEGTEKGFDSAEVEVDAEGNIHQNHHLSLSKSASSTSETSKGSGLSLSPSEIRVNRVKARERARERAAKEKEKENESRITHHQNVNSIAQNSSFTELLTGGIGSVSNNTTSPTGSGSQNPGGEHNMFHNHFGNGLLGASSSRAHNFHLGNSNFSPLGENHPELQQHFSFVPDHLIPVAATSQPGGGNEYNLNFTISSSLAGFNRGTLQSNSPSILPHLQRFSPIDGPFFIGAVPSAAPTMENHHHQPQQFPAGFDDRLQLCYGDGSRHSDHKGKEKN